MRNVIVSTYVTLDGVHEDPHKWPEGTSSEGEAKFAHDQLYASDALLLGRVTYQGFAEAWPSRSGALADKINSMAKFVASTTLTKAEWHNSTLIASDLPAAVSTLKRQPGQDILIYGSDTLVQTLMCHDLIDELRFWVHPLVLGSGKRIFAGRGETKALELVAATTFDSGVVILSYRPARRDTNG